LVGEAGFESEKARQEVNASATLASTAQVEDDVNAAAKYAEVGRRTKLLTKLDSHVAEIRDALANGDLRGALALVQELREVLLALAAAATGRRSGSGS